MLYAARLSARPPIHPPPCQAHLPHALRARICSSLLISGSTAPLSRCTEEWRRPVAQSALAQESPCMQCPTQCPYLRGARQSKKCGKML